LRIELAERETGDAFVLAGIAERADLGLPGGDGLRRTDLGGREDLDLRDLRVARRDPREEHCGGSDPSCSGEQSGLLCHAVSLLVRAGAGARTSQGARGYDVRAADRNRRAL